MAEMNKKITFSLKILLKKESHPIFTDGIDMILYIFNRLSPLFNPDNTLSSHDY